MKYLLVAAVLVISLGAPHAEQTLIDIEGMRDVGAGIFRMGNSFETISNGIWLAGAGIFLMGPMVGVASIIRALRRQPKPVSGA
jgi:hypothetical protein